MDKKELLSVSEAAEELGLSTVTVYGYCKRGMLGNKIGNWNWVITRKDLERFKAIPRPTGRPRKNKR